MIMILSRVRNMIASAAQRACRRPVGGPGIALGIEQVHAATARNRNQRSASAASRTDFRGFRCRNLEFNRPFRPVGTLFDGTTVIVSTINIY